MKEVPTWIFHGEEDPVISVGDARMIAGALEKAGASVKYTEYKNKGHGVWGLAYAEPALFPWLFSQHREQPAPHQ
jgi:predicted peptidase